MKPNNMWDLKDLEKKIIQQDNVKSGLMDALDVFKVAMWDMNKSISSIFGVKDWWKYQITKELDEFETNT